MGKAVKYEPLVIKKHAAKLYGRADSVVAVYSLLGLVLGAVLGFGGTATYSLGGDSDAGMIVALVLGLLGLLFGYATGSERAFALRLQAQVALCQVSIETNTLELRRLVYSAVPAQQASIGSRPTGVNQ